jgi:hypothetical protein
MAEIGDPFARGSGVTRVMNNVTAVASKWSGLAVATRWAQLMAATAVQNKMMQAVSKGGQDEWLRFLNINQGTQNRMAGMFKKYGEVVDGVFIAHTEKWTEGLEGAELKNADELVRAYRNALRQEVDSIIVQQGMGDAPNFASTPLGKMLLQFMTYNMSAHQKVMLRGFQEGPARFVSTIAGMTTIGIGIAMIQAWRNGETSWEKFKKSAENPGFLISEGLDKAGVFPMLFDISNRIDSTARGMGAGQFNPLKTPMIAAFPGDSQAGDQSRWGHANGAWSLAGPTANFIFGDVPKAAGAGLQWAQGESISQGEAKAMSRILLFQTYIGMKEGLQMIYGDSPYMR